MPGHFVLSWRPGEDTRTLSTTSKCHLRVPSVPSRLTEDTTVPAFGTRNVRLLSDSVPPVHANLVRFTCDNDVDAGGSGGAWRKPAARVARV